jgi:hypothetical protein
MKTFFQFVNESKSLASIHGRRLGLVPDGHGGYHDKNTGEFVAKNVAGRLKFYNQNQIVGGQDPAQVRTAANQRPVATQNPSFRKKNTVKINPTESIGRDQERELRERYIVGEIFKCDTFVQNIKTGIVGKIVRRGANHLICVTENDQMFKSWIKDVKEVKEIEVPSKSLKTLVKGAVNRKDDNIDGFVDKEDKKVGPYGAFIPQTRNIPKNFKIKEWTNQSGVAANQREVGTDAFREYVMRLTSTKKIKNFINKYKAKNRSVN